MLKADTEFTRINSVSILLKLSFRLEDGAAICNGGIETIKHVRSSVVVICQARWDPSRNKLHLFTFVDDKMSGLSPITFWHTACTKMLTFSNQSGNQTIRRDVFVMNVNDEQKETITMKERFFFFAIFGLLVLVGLFALQGCAGGNPLAGTAWSLTAINGTPVIEGTEPYLIFDENSVGGNSSCNSTGGNYQVSGNQITFGALVSTMMYCMEPEGVMDQESNFLNALSNAATFNISGNQLVIETQDSGQLTFVSRPQD
ncbi:MAG TPA: META domain-containing protein [Chloroflexi bacterium]|nr:META domain-containing protein [Chloroflexota bacterium]